MNDKEIFLLLVPLLFRIFAIPYCAAKAEELNRSKLWWGLFAFFAPILAAILILVKKPIINWEENIAITIEEPRVVEEKKHYSHNDLAQNKSENNNKTKSLKTQSKPKENNQYSNNQPILKKIDKNSDRY